GPRPGRGEQVGRGAGSAAPGRHDHPPRGPRRPLRHGCVRPRLRAGRGTHAGPGPAPGRTGPPRGGRGLPGHAGESRMSTALRVENLSGGYLKAPILRDMSLEVDEGEVVALFGANGAGQTTLLRDRQAQRAGTLSGGEQQMLALARAVMARPSVMLIDEMSAGLAPVAAQRLVEAVGDVRARGVAVVLVEQAPQLVSAVIDRAYLIERGAIVAGGTLEELGGAT